MKSKRLKAGLKKQCKKENEGVKVKKEGVEGGGHNFIQKVTKENSLSPQFVMI